ncbi:hypothetical protein [Streptomyces sp. NPDC048252]|uniref:hypothetical protein n=1 Tax=Streptomyces sp. NPDC048252 TaxID=3154612 RepID=UPI003434D978
MAAFSDDFDRANSTDLGAGWVEVSGDWSIVSNQLSSGSAGGTIILRAASAMASNDHSAQVTIAATTSASHGVWCRGNPSGGLTSGYLWRNDGSSWDLFRVVGGSFTAIGTYAAAAAPGDVAKVQAVGSTITAYVNGVLRVSVVDTDVPTGTSVGLRAESVAAIRFDDFLASDVTAGATLGVATSTEAAQPLTGSKAATLGTAGEADAPQAVAGSKTAAMPSATEAETAQPLAGAKNQNLSTAESVEAVQPQAGAKSATLGQALESNTARPLVAAGVADADIDVTVGAPYSPWTVGQPHAAAWDVQEPGASDWEVGALC